MLLKTLVLVGALLSAAQAQHQLSQLDVSSLVHVARAHAGGELTHHRRDGHNNRFNIVRRKEEDGHSDVANVERAVPAPPTAPGCVDSVWCVFVKGNRANYSFLEKKYFKELTLKDGTHVFQYKAGTADSIVPKNGSYMSMAFSSVASIACAGDPTSGPKVSASWSTVDTNPQTNINSYTNECGVSAWVNGDNLYVFIQ